MDKLETRAALLAAFPPQVLTEELLADRQGAWELYDDGALFESSVLNKSWDALEGNFLESHDNALIYLGDTAFRCLLPAYLSYLTEHEEYGGVQYCVAAVLTRKEHPLQMQTFDRRVAGLDDRQRRVVKQVLEGQARGHRKDMMTAAWESFWRDLPSL